jgi:hypothetical protein
LVFGSDFWHPFIKWIRISTDVVEMMASDLLMYYLVRYL